MLGLYRVGKIRAIGVSNFSVAQMEAFRGIAPLHTVQPPYNLFERDAETDILPYCRSNGIAALAYGPLCRGLLSGRRAGHTLHRRRYSPAGSEVPGAAAEPVHRRCGAARSLCAERTSAVWRCGGCWTAMGSHSPYGAHAGRISWMPSARSKAGRSMPSPCARSIASSLPASSNLWAPNSWLRPIGWLPDTRRRCKPLGRNHDVGTVLCVLYDDPREGHPSPM